MKKIQRLSFLATLSIAIGMISWGSALQAQNTTPSTMPDRQAQQPSSSPDSTPAQQTPQTSPTPAPSTPETTPSSPDASVGAVAVVTEPGCEFAVFADARLIADSEYHDSEQQHAAIGIAKRKPVRIIFCGRVRIECGGGWRKPDFLGNGYETG